MPFIIVHIICLWHLLSRIIEKKYGGNNMNKKRATIVFVVLLAMLFSSMLTMKNQTVVSAEEVTTEESQDKKSEETSENKTEEKKKESAALEASTDDVKVTVTFNDDANIPEGTKLTVKQYSEKDENYDKKMSEVEDYLLKKKTKTKKYEIETFDLFDISLINDDKEIEPENDAKVSVSLSYINKDIESKKKLKIMHFVDDKIEEVEINKSSLDDGEVKLEFETTSFSEFSSTSVQENEIKTQVRPALRAAASGTINTADNRADGITINLFDYYGERSNYGSTVSLNDSSNVPSQNGNYNVPYNYQLGINDNHRLKFTSWGQVGNTLNHFTGENGPARTGIVQDRLINGYPVLSNNTTLQTNGESLAYLFNTNNISGAKKVYKNVSYLMTKDSDGMYSYNSNNNYAYYDPSQGDNGNFRVYSDTYNTTNNTSYKVGFFPFTEYESSQKNIDNRQSNYYNHHFGMHMNASFTIPSDGKVNGKDIVYEYSGDDDMWLYIDGVLVLDIGGIHEPVHGKINFTTGEVTVYPQNNPSNVTKTTLKAIFEKQGLTWTRNTIHSLDMFYLERGGQYSNLSMSLNVPIIKTVSIRKNVEGEMSEEYLDKDFSFTAYVDKGNGEYVPYSGKIEIGSEEKTINDGKFTLKPTQTARLLEMNTSWKYKIVETGLDGNTFSAVVIDSDGSVTRTLKEGETNQSTSSENTSVSNAGDMVFTNKIREEHGNINVGKKWVGDTESERPSSIKFQLYRVKNGDEQNKELYLDANGNSLFELNSSNWNKVFSNLLRRSGSDVYTYIVQEISVPSGYTDTYSSEDASNHGQNLFITNTKETSVSYEKKWLKADGQTPLTTNLPDEVKVQLYQYKMKAEKTTIENPIEYKKVTFKTTYKGNAGTHGSNTVHNVGTQQGDYTISEYVQKNGKIRFTVRSYNDLFGILSINASNGTLTKVEGSEVRSENGQYQDESYNWPYYLCEATYELSGVTDDTTVTINMVGYLYYEGSTPKVSSTMDVRNITVTNPSDTGTTVIYTTPTPPSTMPEEGTEGLVKYGSERTLNNGNNWKDVVSSLPVEETINGEKYYYFYYVKEVKAPAGFSVSYEGNNGTGQSVIIKNIKDYFPMTFKKIDSTDNSKVLEGATFSLYKDEDCTQIVTFYSDENMQQEATTFTTGSDGKFTVYGLKEGTYYLKEVSAPSGYYLIDHPLKITMDLEGVITIDDKDKDVVQVHVNESNVSDITVVVKDSPLYYLPNSGGIGTHIFTMMGTMLIALAATFYIVNKRNEEGDVS